MNWKPSTSKPRHTKFKQTQCRVISIHRVQVARRLLGNIVPLCKRIPHQKSLAQQVDLLEIFDP